VHGEVSKHPWRSNDATTVAMKAPVVLMPRCCAA